MSINIGALSREEARALVKDWAQRLNTFSAADPRRAIGQLITTVTLLIALVSGMVWLMPVSLPLALLLALPAGGLVVRLFIIQHDCGHQSFLPTRAGNDTIGRLVSIFTLTPYSLWRREHALHHASSGNLDRRGVGDIDTWTLREWKRRSAIDRLGYRIYRNPLFLFGFGIPFYFLFIQRQPWNHGLPAKDGWKSVLVLDLALVAVYGPVAYFIGLSTLLWIVVPIVVVAASAGGWLFYIQHQFEGTYWRHQEGWDYQVAAVLGSSYYDLPGFLNWFTGHIGLHHIHHLNSRIPNYRLAESMKAIPEFKALNRLTILESLKCVRLKVWDEDQRRLLTFAEASAAG
jgi:omega-6 fatty acid desaturase (delta-12 desaturase)